MWHHKIVIIWQKITVLYSLPVSHKWDMMRLHGIGSLCCHSQAFVMGLDGDENGCTVTHWLLIMGWDEIRLPSRKCHSLAVGHGMRWDEADAKISPHFLLVMGWDVMRLPGRKSAHCYSPSVSHVMRCDKTARQKIRCCHSQTVDYGMILMWLAERKPVHCYSHAIWGGDEMRLLRSK